VLHVAIIGAAIIFIATAAVLHVQGQSILFALLAGIGVAVALVVVLAVLVLGLVGWAALELATFDEWLFPALRHVFKKGKALEDQ
jgi:hypothetical protein